MIFKFLFIAVLGGGEVLIFDYFAVQSNFWLVFKGFSSVYNLMLLFELFVWFSYLSLEYSPWQNYEMV